jgi:DNA-binding IclR family transcriptional regulator
LREFGKHSTQLGVSQLARSVGVGKSTAHRVIWTLVEEGLLEKVEETGLFRLTSVMRGLGASAETAQRLHEAATLPLDNLRPHTTGTLHVAILDGFDVLYVERREGRGAIPVFRSVGARNASYVTSSGKVLLAYLPDDQLQSLVASMRLVPRTPRTITSRSLLLAELALVRR